MNVLKVAKLGKNALTATDPRDFIINSDFNTPKIIKEATHSPTLGVAGAEAFTDKAHGLNYTPFVFGFCKFNDGRVGLPGTRNLDENFDFTNLRVNATNVRFGYLNNSGGNYAPDFRYLATEMPLAGTPNIAQGTGNKIAIAKTGFDALTETNPNNLVYDSRWKTLKYFDQGEVTGNVPVLANPTVAGVNYSYEYVINTHNLGFYPFFTAYSEFFANNYINMPDNFADAGFWGYNSVQVTKTQIIFRADVGDSFGGFTAGGYAVHLFWKIFSFDLGL
jgi:hypothetical protein